MKSKIENMDIYNSRASRRNTKKNYVSIYAGKRRIFPSSEIGIIEVKPLIDYYSDYPELDKHGYLKQLKILKKDYVICLNHSRSIDLITLNLLMGKNHKIDERLIFLSDQNHKIIQSNNYQVIELIRNSLAKYPRVKTLCNPEKSKAMIQLKHHSISIDPIPLEDIIVEESRLSMRYLAYRVYGMRKTHYKLKDLKVMLLPIEGSSMMIHSLKIFPIPMSLPYPPDIFGILKDHYPGFGRDSKILFSKIFRQNKPLYDYLESLFEDLSIQDLLVNLIKIRGNLDIPDFWDVDETTADYYLYEGGEDWFRDDHPDNYKFYNQFVRKIFKEYQLLSDYRKSIFFNMLRYGKMPILPTLALLRDKITPHQFSEIFMGFWGFSRKMDKLKVEDKSLLNDFITQVFDILEIMDPYQSIKTLIEKDESEILEFKSTYRYSLHKKNYDNQLIHEVLKTLSAFLNTKGGSLIIGVSDHKDIIGIEKDGFKSNDKFMLAVEQMMIKSFGKSIASTITLHIEDYQGKKLCIIECPKANEPVFVDHFANKKKKDIYYVRTGPSTVSLGLREYQRHMAANFKSKK